MIDSFKKWYEKHKVEYNLRRKIRYKLDDAYREWCKEISRRYALKEPLKDISYRKIRYLKKKVINGKILMNKGEICDRIGISRPTFDKWQKEGIIPQPDYLEPIKAYYNPLTKETISFRHWYSEDFYQKLRRYVLYARKKRLSRQLLRKMLKEAFTKKE